VSYCWFLVSNYSGWMVYLEKGEDNDLRYAVRLAFEISFHPTWEADFKV